MEQRTFTTRDGLQVAVRELLQEAMSRPGAVMLSGGSTPLPIYRKITTEPFEASSEAVLFMSDERMVPSSSPEHNGAQIVPMAEATGVGKIIQVAIDLDIEDAAEDFHQKLKALVEESVPFTLGVLGLGTDGHTASLFSVQDAQREDGQLAIPVRKAGGPDRVSVTEELIRRFDYIIFLVAGPDKAEMVENLHSAPFSIPAGVAVRNAKRVEIWYSVE